MATVGQPVASTRLPRYSLYGWAFSLVNNSFQNRCSLLLIPWTPMFKLSSWTRISLKFDFSWLRQNKCFCLRRDVYLNKQHQQLSGHWFETVPPQYSPPWPLIETALPNLAWWRSYSKTVPSHLRARQLLANSCEQKGNKVIRADGVKWVTWGKMGHPL